jgi:hypothetical protein
MAHNLEDICVSLETAKRLQEAGIVIESLFSWFYYENATFSEPHLKLTSDNRAGWSSYPAPTAEEFDYQELPDVVECNGIGYFLRITKGVNHWRVYYYDHYNESKSFPDYDHLDPFPNDHSLCEVIASVAIWVKQNIKSEGKDDTYNSGLDSLNFNRLFWDCYHAIERGKNLVALIRASDLCALHEKETGEKNDPYDVVKWIKAAREKRGSGCW